MQHAPLAEDRPHLHTHTHVAQPPRASALAAVGGYFIQNAFGPRVYPAPYARFHEMRVLVRVRRATAFVDALFVVLAVGSHLACRPLMGATPLCRSPMAMVSGTPPTSPRQWGPCHFVNFRVSRNARRTAAVGCTGRSAGVQQHASRDRSPCHRGPDNVASRAHRRRSPLRRCGNIGTHTHTHTFEDTHTHTCTPQHLVGSAPQPRSG